MSRAFVREVDDIPALVLEGSVNTALNLVAPWGARLIEQVLAAIEEQAAPSNEGVLAALRRDFRYPSARRSTMQIVPMVQAPAAVEFVRTTHRRGARQIEISAVGGVGADLLASDRTAYSRNSRRPSWGNR